MSQLQADFFKTETEFFEKITSISGLLKPSQSKDEKKAKIREKLIEYNMQIPACVYLPTNQTYRVVGIVTSSGMPMQSAARVPILVSFEVEDYPGPDNDPILQHQDLLSTVRHLTADRQLDGIVKDFVTGNTASPGKSGLFASVFRDSEKLGISPKRARNYSTDFFGNNDDGMSASKSEQGFALD